MHLLEPVELCMHVGGCVFVDFFIKELTSYLFEVSRSSLGAECAASIAPSIIS